MTEKSTTTRWVLIVGIAVVAIAAVSLLVYYLAQQSSGDPNEASDPTTTETSQPTDEPEDGADDGSSDDADSDAATDGDSGSSDGDDTGSDGPAGAPTYLDEEMSGQEAIDALGDNIDEVAERNNKSVEELEKLLLNNPSARVTPDGFIVFHDTFSNDD